MKRVKTQIFRMCLNLNDYLFKASRYDSRSIYMNAMVITNQKQFHRYTKTKKKGAQQYHKEIHQTTMVETKRRNKEIRTAKITGKLGIKWQ